jgi:hypothetical protein
MASWDSRSSAREAEAVERAVASVVDSGARTADMGPRPGEALSTSAMGERIRDAMKKQGEER